MCVCVCVCDSVCRRWYSQDCRILLLALSSLSPFVLSRVCRACSEVFLSFGSIVNFVSKVRCARAVSLGRPDGALSTRGTVLRRNPQRRGHTQSKHKKTSTLKQSQSQTTTTIIPTIRPLALHTIRHSTRLFSRWMTSVAATATATVATAATQAKPLPNGNINVTTRRSKVRDRRHRLVVSVVSYDARFHDDLTLPFLLCLCVVFLGSWSRRARLVEFLSHLLIRELL